MTTSRFQDKYDRVDGELGSAYLIPCGAAAIFDEAVWPVDADGGAATAFAGTTKKKTQVLVVEEPDGADVQVRGVWSHLSSMPEFDLDIDTLLTDTTEDPSFTLVARMTKDPLLVDLGTDEDPACYDQGYGLRVTCPRDGSAPVLKLVKYAPSGLPPGVAGPTTATESDGAYVMASVTLEIQNLNVNPSQAADDTDPPDYRGFVQSMKLRIRRADDQAILEGYINDRNRDLPLVTYTDHAHPVWGTGKLGYEFLSATSATQPAGTSPFSESGVPVMACHLLVAETVLDRSPAYASTPSNLMTYGRVVDRVIALVEKNGDARYNATAAGQTKRDMYLDFVMEAERDILRQEGFYKFLWKERDLYTSDGVDTYELPEDVGELAWVSPSSWGNPPLEELESYNYQQLVAGLTGSGLPRVYVRAPREVNNRERLRLFPTPDGTHTVKLGYFARLIHPAEPDQQIPHIPQEDIDVLVYSAAAHALLLDSDAENAQIFNAIADRKMTALRQKNNRNLGGYQSVMRHITDTKSPDARTRVPMLRSTQLGHLNL
jgi:hypothetical protein